MSAGEIETLPAGGWGFRPRVDSEVLAERFEKKSSRPLPESALLLKVSTSSSQAGPIVVPHLPSLQSFPTIRHHGLEFQVAVTANGPTYAVQRSDLARLVVSTGGLQGGLNAPQRLAARRLMADAVAAIADRCVDPQAAMAAARALGEAPWVNVQLKVGGDTINSLGDDKVGGELGLCLQPVESAGSRLSRLMVGEHLVVPWAQFRVSGHTMVLGITRVSDTHVTMTAVNSATFTDAGDVSYSKTVELADAANALAGLQDGQVPSRPPYMPKYVWGEPKSGGILLQLLHETAPAAPMALPSTESTTRQKQSSDCGTESYFAWLSTVMPPADYKLAKASMLHGLAELADGLADDADPAGRELLEAARVRLNERLTTSLAGHAVASAAL